MQDRRIYARGNAIQTLRYALGQSTIPDEHKRHDCDNLSCTLRLVHIHPLDPAVKQCDSNPQAG